MSFFAQPFEQRLQEQLELLGGYERLFDCGAWLHGKSIAVRAHVIIEMLKAKEGGEFIRRNSVQFLTPIDPTLDVPPVVNPLVRHTLFFSHDDRFLEARHVPTFQDTGTTTWYETRLSKWLSQGCFLSSYDVWLSREAAITLMRNKDGGGHPSSDPGKDYREFEINRGAIALDAGHAVLPPLPLAVMREIAYELSNSLNPHL